MMHVALCITQKHDLGLVALALLVCLVGAAACVQLYRRIRAASGHSRTGWIMLAAVGTGTMVWATHFVAMMAFRTDAPVILDPMLTLASLLVAISIAALGLAVAALRQTWSGAVGGGIIGVAISTMHYLGMSAYRVDGIVTWAWSYVAASIALSVILGGAAFHVLGHASRRGNVLGAGLLGLAVASLHFTGMAAMDIAVLRLGGGLSDVTMTALAMATAVGAIIVVGCAAVSALIDGHTQSESFLRMRRMALHDGLTDLPNRISFNEELARRLALKGGYSCMAVIMLDLSRFKAVNDTHGHQAGDQLLMALASRLSGALRPGECVARIGGDEFGALVSYEQPDDLHDCLRRLGSAFTAPFEFERFTASVGANMGVALAVHDGLDADQLLAKADLAMYRAKSAHSAEPCFYDAVMDEAVSARRSLSRDLREAVRDGTFELCFQVQASIATGEITGYEALVRWAHPIRGYVSPAEFIPIAEESGLIVPLSVWVLRQACFEAALWPNRHVVAVNLSPIHLSDPTLVGTVAEALAASGLPAHRLSLELTESAIIHDRHFAIQQLRALKAMGIAIALDDFGVGYSSLDVLRSFPFDRIKLDASFVAEIERDEQAVSILRSVAALGATLHMPVLAEGVEQAAQLAIVAREGCSAIQGYLIGKPARTLADPIEVRQAMRLRPFSIGTAVA